MHKYFLKLSKWDDDSVSSVWERLKGITGDCIIFLSGEEDISEWVYLSEKEIKPMYVELMRSHPNVVDFYRMEEGPR